MCKYMWQDTLPNALGRWRYVGKNVVDKYTHDPGYFSPMFSQTFTSEAQPPLPNKETKQDNLAYDRGRPKGDDYPHEEFRDRFAASLISEVSGNAP